MKHTLLTGLELARETLDRWNYTLDANPNQAGVADADLAHARS